ncbi:MAG: DNA polymerase IV [Oscillospiraceae bacterium]|nr:DNA polymerase IV [Oscillospiraceae bacterium]
MGGRTILHSDMNSFYASVEMMLHPELQGKAVAVCGSTETRHGIVLAKSELARGAGVKTGMVNWEAERLCPGLILVPPHFEQYVKYSGLARSIYQRYTDFVEPYGMDECFLDVTGSTDMYGGGVDIAEDIRRTIKSELGLTVSVGVSFNKVFAKLGSDMKKPDAVTEITPDGFQDKVFSLPVSDLFFVGKATSKKLLRYGIKTIGDLASLPPDFLREIFGKNGLLIWAYANGLDTSPVMPKDFVTPVKSIGHGITCTADLTTEEDAWRVMLELSQDIGRKLRTQKLKAAGVQLSVKDSGLICRQFQGKMLRPTSNPADIATKARKLFNGNYDWTLPVRALTVRAIDLHDENEAEQMDLFAEIEKRERSEKLCECVEDIRRRFGKHIISSASIVGDINLPNYRDHELTLPGMMAR